MVKFKNVKRMAMATALAAVGFIAGQVASDAAVAGPVYISGATNTNNGPVDFDEATFHFMTNGHNTMSYSLDDGKTWVPVEGLGANDIAASFDISSLAATKDATILIKGTDSSVPTAANYASESSIALGKEVKVTNLKLKYNAPASEILFDKGPAGTYQYRTASTAKWTDVAADMTKMDSPVITGTAVNKLQAKGGTYYARLAATKYADANSTKVATEAAIVRASKMVSTKVTAQAKAPTVKVNYQTGVMTFPKDAEFRMKVTGTNDYFKDLYNTSTVAAVTWVSDSALKPMTSLNIMPYVIASGTKGITVEARTQANATKKESLTTEIKLDAANTAPVQSTIGFDYYNEVFDTASSAALEYTVTVSDTAVKVPEGKVTWTQIKFTGTNKVNITKAISAIKDYQVGTLFIREIGTKENTKTGVANKLPSDWTTYEIKPRPTFATLASISYKDEAVTVSAVTSLIEFSKLSKFAEDTLTSAASANKTVTMGALGINLDDKAYKATKIYYRIQPVTSSAVAAGGVTDYTGSVGSLAQTISIPARPAAPKVSYNKVTQAFTMTLGASYDWKTEATSGSALSTTQVVTAALKTLSHPSSTDSIYMFHWYPEITSYSSSTSKFRSHIFVSELIEKADTKINIVSGSALTESVKVLVSGGAVTKGQKVTETIPNMTATVAFTTAMKGLRTNQRVAATLTVVPDAGFRFNCGNADAARRLLQDLGKVGVVEKAVYTAPTASSQGKIVFTIQILVSDAPAS